MKSEDDEFKALRSRIDQISSEVDKQDRVRAVNTKWMVTVGAFILAALGYTNFIQLPAEATRAAKEQVGPEIMNQSREIVERLRKIDGEAGDIIEELRGSTKYVVPKGTIVAWHPGEQDKKTGSGEIRAPNGWVLCNGENGTPDLRNRFLLGLSVGDFLQSPAKRFGGTAEHDHGSHYHRLLRHDDGEPPPKNEEYTAYCIPVNGATVSQYTTKVTPTKKVDLLPPYAGVIYIMKL